MNQPTDWASAVVILVSGLILGVLLIVYFTRRRKAQKLGGERDLERKDLEAKRDALVQQLRDPGVGDDERRRLEVETAAVLRKLDGMPGSAPAKVRKGEPAPEPTGRTMNPALKGFLWGAGSFAALAALGYFVVQSSQPRQENMPATGGATSQLRQQQQTPQTAAPDPIVTQLEAQVKGDPDNLDLRNDLAQAYLERDNLMGVFEQTKYVLEKSPNDSRALTFQGLVRMAMGQGDLALKMMQQATKSDPKNLDSWVALAWVYAQNDHMADAEKAIAEAAKNSPKDKERLDEVFLQMKQHVEMAKNQAAQPQTAQAGGLPPGHPPVEGGMPAPAASMPATPTSQAGAAVTVTLDLNPAAAQKSGTLFVMARNPMGGPPAAVKRLQVDTFPITIQLSAADSMMGQPLPASFRLEARLDSDGDAMTKLPTDPSAEQDGVTPGAKVHLSLK